MYMLCDILLIIAGVVETQRGFMRFSENAENTATILSFFNDLFDSLNGSRKQGLSSMLSRNSGHASFWKEACQKLRYMQYVERGTHKIIFKNGPKCITNWIWTLEAMQQIWNVLQNANFETINLKFLNQDVLENFFSQIRNSSGSNKSPNPKQFEEAFKGLLISNLTSKHSLEANCMDDNIGKSFALSHLMNLSEIARENQGNTENEGNVDTEQAAVPAAIMNEIAIDADKIITMMSVHKNITECSICFNNLNNVQVSNFIEHVTKKLELKFVEICCKPNITEVIEKFLQEEQHLLVLSSQCQHLPTVLFKTVANEFVTVWCKYMNDILCKKVTIKSTNYMYKAAQRMSMKYTKRKD